MLCLPLKCWHFFLRKLKAKLAFAPTAPRAFDCSDRLAKKRPTSAVGHLFKIQKSSSSVH
jgi:hypothetical protein